ncbi:MAG: type III secretion system inner membrane ring lipoprotein SctJ [Ramlibacter sp.]
MKPLTALLLLILALTGCTRQVELMAAMPEAEANEVMAALQNAGLDADKKPGKEGMVSLLINAEQMGRAVDLLRAKGLPQQRYAGMGQVFKKEGLISSPLEERARYLYALSQELGSTLSQIDGVIVARVHVVLPERAAPGDPGLASSAAVFIKHQQGYDLDTLQPQIRRLVNNAIPGLTPEKISIVLFSTDPQRVANPQATAPAKSTAVADKTLLAGLAAAAVATLAALGLGLGLGLWWLRRRKSGVHDAAEAQA